MRKSESGFALLFVFAMAAAIAFALYMELPRVSMEALRDREQLLISRGEQYKRAIQLYIRKNNQFPPTLDALEKGPNNIRFLRRRYKDPMTGSAEWRLVHVGPGGVFLDSLVNKPPSPDKDKEKTEQAAAAPGFETPPYAAVPGQPVQPGLRRRPSEVGLAGGVTGGAYPQPGQYPAGTEPQITQYPAPGQPGTAYPYPGQQYPGQQPVAGYPQPYPGQQPVAGYPQPYPGQQPVAGYPQPYPGQQPAPGYPQPYPGQQPVPGYPQPGQQPVPGYPQPQPGQQTGPYPFVPGQQQPGVYPPVQPGQQPYPQFPVVQQPGYPQPQPGQMPFPQIQPGQTPPPYPTQGVPGLPGPYGRPGAPTFVQPITAPPVSSQTGGVMPAPYNPYSTQPGVGGAPAMGQTSFQQPGFQPTPAGGPGQNPALDMIQRMLTTPRPGGLSGGQGAFGGQIMGGGIAGVASKAEAEGVMVYNEKTKYNEWEFLYDIRKDPTKMGQFAMGGQPGQLGQPQQTGQQTGQQQTGPQSGGSQQLFTPTQPSGGRGR